jgi:hypothetical protein
MTKRPDHPRPDDDPIANVPWLDRREIGKLLRLIGPLVQIPLIWMFLRDPEFARTHTNWIYGGMIFGLSLVLAGIVMSGRTVRKS